MESITAKITLMGLTGLAGLIIYVGYLFYDKNSVISAVLLTVGVLLAVSIIVSEIWFKKQRHEDPWRYERYKGE